MIRGRPSKKVTPGDHSRQILVDLGISKRQSAEWQKLAEVPEADFLALVRDGDRPSTGSIIRQWHGAKARRVASFERMAAELRAAGWTVVPPGAPLRGEPQ